MTERARAGAGDRKTTGVVPQRVVKFKSPVKAQQTIDDAAAAHDAALFAQRVRKRLGLTQLEFSRRIEVSPYTIHNWEQGKRSPTGAARDLLRVLDKAPEASLMALG